MAVFRVHPNYTSIISLALKDFCPHFSEICLLRNSSVIITDSIVDGLFTVTGTLCMERIVTVDYFAIFPGFHHNQTKFYLSPLC